ncbi:hypothetical protein B9R80_002407 [Salmonella enterica]|nr:hypothetical protein [Salmonella enterica]
MKRYSLGAFLIALSGLVGYQIGLGDLASFAHDAFTITRKNLDKSCFYDIHQNVLFAICPK